MVIGNGKNTHLLWDCWLSNGPLIKTHGSRIAMKSGLSADAEVADVIRHSAWCWPNAMPEDMEEVQCAYSLIVPSEAEDQFIWKLTPDVVCFSSSTKEFSWEKGIKIQWCKLVWGPLLFQHPAKFIILQAENFI